MSTPEFITAGYAQGALYPATNLLKNAPLIQGTGWNTIILGLFHIGRDYDISPPQITGDIYFNDTLIISRGKYVGDPAWLAAVAKLISGSVRRVCASIGGWREFVYDFRTIQKIWEGNNKSFNGTNLMNNLRVLKTAFPSISIIDMDNEENYDQPSFVAFCEMLIHDIGYDITFCPFENGDIFWAPSLKAIESKYPGRVVWWNLQCYAGGGGNNPKDWAAYLQGIVNPNGYIVASDWTRFWDDTNKIWGGDCPPDLNTRLARFKGQACIGGGFIWTFDQIFDYAGWDKDHPGGGCGAMGGSTSAYYAALVAALKP